MHTITLIGYMIVAIFSSFATWLIIGRNRRAELDQEYSKGFDEARDSTIFPAVLPDDEEIQYSTRSFTARIPDMSEGDYDFDGAFEHLYQTSSSPEPGTLHPTSVQSGPRTYDIGYGSTQYGSSTQYGRAQTQIYESTPTDLEIQNQVTQLCQDMDRECEIYLAKLATQSSKWQADNTYRVFTGESLP